MVIRYLQNTNDRFPIFVANRITNIKEISDLSEWHYVNSASNPADDASRARQSTRWVEGPNFLRLSEECTFDKPSDLEVELEIIQPRVVVHTTTTAIHPIARMVERCSEWVKLKRMVSAWMLVKRWLRGVRGERVEITATDMKDSEIIILKYIQHVVYNREIEALETGRSLGGSSLLSLDVRMRQGLLCVGGRLARSDLSLEQRNPVILPSRDHVTSLIVRDAHAKMGHLGPSAVLNKLRERFWVIRGQSTVRRVLNECIPCRKVKRYVSGQKMADLHSYRVTSGEPPFTRTGVDCFGPFFVKIGRRREKRYGMIFTCLAMRAVHLELANDLSTDGTVNAIRRFMARRGSVKTFVSDNGTNFVGARGVLLSFLSSNEVKNRLVSSNIDWEFNPPCASHFGGAWESLIRIVRRVLDVIMYNRCLDEDSLVTLFCEAEAAINSRPLTFVSSDCRDIEAITPNKLLMLRDCQKPLSSFPNDESYSRKRWRQVQFLADCFWKRWSKEYLVSLQNRSKWNKEVRNVKEGDVVLLVDNTQARCQWPMGRVEEAFTGNDGLVRSAKIWSRGKMYRRPVAKLIVLLENQDQI